MSLPSSRSLKIAFISIVAIITLLVITVVLFTPSLAHKAYDIKADMVGTNRTITFYSPITSEPVRSYTDRDTRFEIPPTGGISVWLGSQNRKVHSNMPYIIEDNR